MKTVIIVRGPSSVGKSTVSAAISRMVKHPVSVVEIDALVEMDGRRPKSRKDVNVTAAMNAGCVANGFMDGGIKTVIVEGALLSDEILHARDMVLSKRKNDVKVISVFLALPVRISMRRRMERDKIKNIEKKMLALEKTFSNPKKDSWVWWHNAIMDDAGAVDGEVVVDVEGKSDDDLAKSILGLGGRN